MSQHPDVDMFLECMEAASKAVEGVSDKILAAGFSTEKATAIQRAMVCLLVRQTANHAARSAIFAAFPPAVAEELLAKITADFP